MTEHLVVKSYGETREADRTGLCRCRPTNVLYWELSEADSSDCPIHGCPFCSLGSDCPSCGGTGQRGAVVVTLPHPTEAAVILRAIDEHNGRHAEINQTMGQIFAVGAVIVITVLLWWGLLSVWYILPF